ncbi:eCIS core domain-containing protein [Streptomyces griseoluteus]|uniref:eCIS core domain-containing protein n=1 Tax=Streptomyces griseoluteus TaxID=29306 RepID=UPI00365C2BD2
MRKHEEPDTAPARSRRPAARPAVPAQAPPSLRALQRSVGNATVARMLSRRDEEADAPSLQRRSSVHDVLRSAGRPLEPGVRAEMEGRFGGADFGDVRVHKDPAAQRSAAEIGARAYTSGRHIVIGENGADKHTLAHELTHVVQQRSGPVAGTDTGQGLRLSDPSDRFEREAEANAHRVMSGGDHSHTPSAGPAHEGGRAPVQRYVEISPGDDNYPSKHRRSSIGSNKSAESDDHFFPSQQEASGSYFSDAQTRTANISFNGSAPLRLSDSFDLAIEQGPGESKVFFATEAHIRAANEALAGRVRLRQGSRFLKVTGESGELRLYQVKPVVETKRTGAAGALGMTKKATGLSVLTPQRCNEMAEFVTGKKGLSSQGIGAWENFLARVLDLVDGSGSTHLDGVKEAFQKGVAGDKDAYLSYSQSMSRTFQDLKAANSPELDAALRTLGLNEFLPPPPPGSALVTVGYGDAAQEESRDRDNTFEYHFGATVATSGNDYVTMENYARRDPGVGNATASSGDPLFYFKMYGTRPDTGDTWHSTQLATGGFIGAILSITLEG